MKVAGFFSNMEITCLPNPGCFLVPLPGSIDVNLGTRTASVPHCTDMPFGFWSFAFSSHQSHLVPVVPGISWGYVEEPASFLAPEITPW